MMVHTNGRDIPYGPIVLTFLVSSYLVWSWTVPSGEWNGTGPALRASGWASRTETSKTSCFVSGLFVPKLGSGKRRCAAMFPRLRSFTCPLSKLSESPPPISSFAQTYATETMSKLEEDSYIVDTVKDEDELDWKLVGFERVVPLPAVIRRKATKIGKKWRIPRVRWGEKVDITITGEVNGFDAAIEVVRRALVRECGAWGWEGRNGGEWDGGEVEKVELKFVEPGAIWKEEEEFAEGDGASWGGAREFPDGVKGKLWTPPVTLVPRDAENDVGSRPRRDDRGLDRWAEKAMEYWPLTHTLTVPFAGMDEVYRLKIVEDDEKKGKAGTVKVVVEAATEWGMLRGLTVLSLLQRGKTLPGPGLEVVDAPRTPWRGLSLDLARHFLPIPTIKRIIASMALARLNTLHLHLVDAQSFSLDFGTPVFSKLSSAGAFQSSTAPQHGLRLTAKDASELVQYATERGVRIVPEVDVPAHAASWSLADPSLVAHCPDTVRTLHPTDAPLKTLDIPAINVTNPHAYETIAKVLAGVAAIFPDSFMHLGGDEVNMQCLREEPTFEPWALETFGSASPSAGQVLKHFYSTLLATWRRTPAPYISHPFSAEPSLPIITPLTPIPAGLMIWQDTLDLTGFDAWQGDGDKDPLLHSIGAQPWKCWSRLDHAAATKAVEHGRGVVQSACWYLDWDSDWKDFYGHDDSSKGVQGAGTDAWWWKEDGGDKVEGVGLLWGGEGAMWEEESDWTNVECRIWPRLVAIAERLWTPTGARVILLPFPPSASSEKKEDEKEVKRVAKWKWEVDAAEGRMVAFRDILASRGVLASPITSPKEAASTLWDVNAGMGACGKVRQEVQRNVRFGPAHATQRDDIEVMRVMMYNIDYGGRGSQEASDALAAENPDVFLEGDLYRKRHKDWWALKHGESPKEVTAANRQLDWIRNQGVDLVGICEAVGWIGAETGSDRDDIVVDPEVLRTRAKRAGFPFSQLLRTPAGFDLGIMAARPIHVLEAIGGADVEHFERGLLAANVGGLGVIVVHLHAHDAKKRAAEAARVVEIAKKMEEEKNLPTILMGDLNTLSPLDAHCHKKEKLLDFLTTPPAPSYLQTKFLRDGKKPTSKKRIDYRPMGILLSGNPNWDDHLPPKGYFADLTVDSESNCLGTEPTAVSMIDAFKANEVPPFRLDFVLAAPLAQSMFINPTSSGSTCQILQTEATMVMSDHFPVSCNWPLHTSHTTEDDDPWTQM